MLEASAFQPSAKATLNRSRHERALAHIVLLNERLHPRCLLGPNDRGSLAYRSLPAIAELVEQLAIAMRTSQDGAEWTELWRLYCRWQAILAPLLEDFVATAGAAGFEPDKTTKGALARALLAEYELRDEAWA